MGPSCNQTKRKNQKYSRVILRVGKQWITYNYDSGAVSDALQWWRILKY